MFNWFKFVQLRWKQRKELEKGLRKAEFLMFKTSAELDNADFSEESGVIAGHLADVASSLHHCIEMGRHRDPAYHEVFQLIVDEAEKGHVPPTWLRNAICNIEDESIDNLFSSWEHA